MESEAVEVSSGIVTGNAILALCPVLFSATFLRPVAAGHSILSAFFKTSSLRNNPINMPNTNLVSLRLSVLAELEEEGSQQLNKGQYYVIHYDVMGLSVLSFALLTFELSLS
ncbi:hypothetical protein AeRB84_006866 [Aphanomyces euteiches]|nr:hypothetical protein AeRB84_006866 [Aphanomyces euteiches]